MGPTFGAKTIQPPFEDESVYFHLKNPDGREWRQWRYPSTLSAAVDALVAEAGPPHALVNNAGITADGLMLKLSADQWDQVIAANLRSVFLFARQVMPSMMERRSGVILQMSSISAIKGNVGQTNYAATKAGMLGVTRSLSLETARFNIRVNAILPGLVDTEMLSQMPERDRTNLARQVPLRRLCRVGEVAALTRFLLSEDAAYITGQAFAIDGGLTA